ncbi:unnamed protein product [Thelazia callipaeda]|uniref:Etoposide-induced protein 2.4 n=1 Tax=Thelazia callipaeda TaxID=103827 RepID=A0A158RBR7_THECL|nr:unnamed protein product [Thelazia callipaeda]
MTTFVIWCPSSIIHKLDKISDEESTISKKKQEKLLHPVVTTVLQQRRQAANRTEIKRAAEIIAKPKALTGLIYSLLVNMVLVTFLYFTMPDETSKFLRIVHGSFCVCALVISRIFGSIWFSDIANVAQRYTGVQVPNFKVTSDFCSSLCLDCLIFLQSLFVSSIPVPMLAEAFSLIHLALLNSLFSFEYVWMSFGIGSRARIDLIERHWPYFLGFGTILTILSTLTNSVVANALLFGAVFPLCIISSYLVKASDYNQRSYPYIHIFGPSLAAYDYLASVLFNFLKSLRRKRGTQVARMRVKVSSHQPT